MYTPSDQNLMSNVSLAMEALEFEFFGKTAHAAGAPWEGINALDAAINMFNMVNAGRQQLRPDARVHGIIAEGGVAANIIPEYTRVQFYVRSLDINYLQEVKDMVIRSAEAASSAAGTTMKYNYFEKSYYNMITNQKLSDTYNANAADLGIEMIDAGEDLSGSIDMGNVSQVVPSIHSYYEITDGVPTAGHTVEFREATRTEFGYKAMMRTVEILARTGFDVITKPELLAEIKEEFSKIEKVN